MEHNEQRERRNRKARERQAKRSQRRETITSSFSEGLTRLAELKPKRVPPPVERSYVALLNIVQDTFWYLRRNPKYTRMIAGGAVALVVLFFLSLYFSPNIGPNISAMGIAIGGMSVEDAAAKLEETLANERTISLRLEGEQIASVTPAELGIDLDAEATVQLAKEARLSGIPFGHEVAPTFVVDYGVAQTYLLGLVDEVFIPPYEAGYEWRNGEIVAVPGSASRELDVVLTAQRIADNPLEIIERGRLDLLITNQQPNVMDSTPYLEAAQAFINSGLTIIGYDPFKDETQQWQTTQEEMAHWIVASPNGIAVRESSLNRFVDSVNNLLNTGDYPRFINEDFLRDALNEAIETGETTVELRINYLPRRYTVEQGQTGFSIGRATGLPFRLIDEANPGLEWNQLSVGQEIMLPSRDSVVPIDPISDKRIIVDLDRFYMVAYENDEMVYHAPISIGMDDYPTSPGIYQILEKVDVAYGSTFNLCGDRGCGQWQMDYFMGIYEVAPGLTNGFHGAVLLPNGGYLDGGSSQLRSTFGCVMADNGLAEQLYNWADVGTMVEIVSREFEPESELARQAITFMDEQNQL